MAEIRWRMRGMKNAVPIILFGAWVVESVVLAVGPVSRATWWAENITVWVVVTPVVWLYVKGIRFSNTAYVLMSVLVFLHTIGGHYIARRGAVCWVTDWPGRSGTLTGWRISRWGSGFSDSGVCGRPRVELEPGVQPRLSDWRPSPGGALA